MCSYRAVTSLGLQGCGGINRMTGVSQQVVTGSLGSTRCDEGVLYFT